MAVLTGGRTHPRLAAKEHTISWKRVPSSCRSDRMSLNPNRVLQIWCHPQKAAFKGRTPSQTCSPCLGQQEQPRRYPPHLTKQLGHLSIEYRLGTWQRHLSPEALFSWSRKRVPSNLWTRCRASTGPSCRPNLSRASCRRGGSRLWYIP